MADERNGSWKAVYFVVLTFSSASDGLMPVYVSQRSDEPGRRHQELASKGVGFALGPCGRLGNLSPVFGVAQQQVAEIVCRG